jgi:NADH-quinone oxidoreductase subunit C
MLPILSHAAVPGLRRVYDAGMSSSGSPDLDASDLGARLAILVDGASVSVSGGGSWGRATVDVAPERWSALVTAARDALGCDFFDWLSAVDDGDAGLAVVAHLWSTRQRYGVLLRSRVPRDGSALASIVDVYPGAAWSERETYEMFNIDFVGHPDLTPLLLPPGFEGHPLRKDFILASRVAKAWPGAKEPGESEADAGSGSRRAPMRPPGVPEPGQWGSNGA